MSERGPLTTVALKRAVLSIQTGPFGSQLHAADYVPGGRPVINPAHLRDGRIVPDTDSEIDEDTFKRLSHHELVPGDVLLGRRGELGRCGVVTADQAGWVCGTGSIRIRANPTKLDPMWLRWVLTWRGSRDWLSLESVGSTMENLGAEAVGALPIPLPEMHAQQELVAHLDRETGRIDKLIVAKQRLLDLLAEKRKVVIASAVTRGLDAAAAMRKSIAPWLGEVPSHWRDLRLRFLLERLEQGWSPEAENREPGHEEWGVLKLNAVSRGQYDGAAAKALPASLKPRPELQIEVGDVLVTRANTPLLVGDACYVAQTRPRLMLCDLIYRLRVRPRDLDGRYLSLFLITAFGRAQVESVAKGTSGSMVKISQDHIKDWWIPVPPLEEQRAIVAHIARETSKIDRLRAATERTIALLKERRAALIAAAVTGQIDVTRSAP